MAAVMKQSTGCSDEEWLVLRARSCMKTDQYAAKAWMITARSLFPRNFTIQFEAYTLEKVGKNVKEAAKLLEEMFMVFSNEDRLWEEIHQILEILQTEAMSDGQNNFLTEIFAEVSTHVQCQMLLTVAEKISNTLEQCRLLLLAMRKFPNLVGEHGLKLLETLHAAEMESNVQHPINCYRKLLVYDVLPLVLQRQKAGEIPPSKLYHWLKMAIDFYISYVTHPPSGHSSTVQGEMLSPTKSSKRQIPIPGLFERECQVTDPWGNLLKTFLLIGQHLGWEPQQELFSPQRETNFKQLFTLYNRSKQAGKDVNLHQILYTAVILFLHCLFAYVSAVDPESFIGTNSNHLPLVMVEGFKQESASESSPSKKLKTQTDTSPKLLATSSVPDSQHIISSFSTAFKCYELLHSSTELQREFMSLCEMWHMETWTWMGHFQTDMLIYQGAFMDAIAHLQNFSTANKESMKVRSSLQMACCFFSLHKYMKACELVLNVIKEVSVQDAATQMTNRSQVDKSHIDPSRRSLLLTVCSQTEILPYCVELLIACYKTKLNSAKSDDLALGHLIILLQYDWPKFQHVLSDVVQKIQKQGSFIYNLFFNYVINVDILEEVTFLKSQEGGKINLDILCISTKAIAQQRAVTRGVNKGVKEDFKVAMEKQVSRCEENIDKLIMKFLCEERQSLLKALS
ncbi:hypothetical protein FSP39_019808 [Pinctada imbricata]|uniref:Integrator complex subunit 10 n=1 Tax=Pinctada imbricata TaxID=66713 RepID=A0AA88YM73_PINIB|nr:hypothetical protein FSP39_019808 [Pinctada imbricata]